MSSAVQTLTTPEQRQQRSVRSESARASLGYLRRNPALLIGLLFLFSLLLFVVIGHFTVDLAEARPLSVIPLQPPSRDLPFGSDKQGRNLYAVMVVGTPLTLRIGLFAGTVGIVVGATLAFIAGYYGGIVDNIIKAIVDPARTIRSQVLTLKQRGYVQVARLSGMSSPEIIVKELMPNLLPYLGASFVGAVSAGVLAAIGLEVLGLGPFEAPTLGMTIYWINYNAAIINAWWWWWVPPIVVIGILFTGLFLVAVGLDEIANPRVRNRV
jgi:peptide/nickel transport system permease protein